MLTTQDKGDIGQMAVATDLLKRGYKIALPYGENWSYDLILDRGQGKLERVQIKFTESKNDVVMVRCRSISTTKGKVNKIKTYSTDTIDWMAVYDKTTDRCYYLSADELGPGEIPLRLAPAKSGQIKGIRMAEDYLEI